MGLIGGECLDFNMRAPYCRNAHEIIKIYIRSKKRKKENSKQGIVDKFIQLLTSRPLPEGISSKLRYIVNSQVLNS